MKRIGVYTFFYPENKTLFFRIMKMIVFFMFAFMFAATAETYSQKQVVSLNLHQSDIGNLFNEVWKQTGLRFVYNEKHVAGFHRFDIQVKDKAVDEVLERVFNGSQLRYVFDGNVIYVLPRNENSTSTDTLEKVNVTGQVLDGKGSPLPGVTVALKVPGAKKLQIGTVTNADGRYQLSFPSGEELSLVFSFIGMKTLEVRYKAQASIDVTMQEEIEEIDEVVITGYYTANKKTYTGAATSISKEDIQKISTTNIFTVLQTLDPSFQIVDNIEQGSNPNALPEFVLRGAGSVTALKSEYDGDPNMPLFMVDGFEMGVEKVFDLDPLRIESMTVLKDAAATAIYGSRASNGVVVIELLRPQKGKLRLDYNLRYILTAPDLTSYDLLDARRKFQLEKEAGIIKPLTDTYNEKLSNVEKGFDTYWLDKPLHVGHDFSHALSVSGGDDNITYSVDLHYNPNTGVMIGSNRKRFSVGSRLAYRVKEVTLSNSLNYDYTSSKNSPYGDYSQYGKLNPYYRIEDDNGDYLYLLDNNGVFNPLWNTRLKEINKSDYNLFSDNLDFKWYITPTLQLSVSGGVNVRNGQTEKFFSALHTMFGLENDMEKRGSYTAVDSKSVNWQGNVFLTYSHHLGLNYFTWNAGLNYADTDDRSHGFSAEGFVSQNLSDPSFAFGYAKNSRPYGNSSKSRSAGTFLNVNYSYNNIYFADASFRADISSRFGKDSRWAPFWSLGLGYNIHNEVWMKQVEFVDLLKIRFSYGLTGSQNYDPYQAMTKYQYLSGEFYNGNTVAATMQGLGNPDLKWQRSYQKNLGIDIGLLSNRLVLTANYYTTTSKDVLTPVTIAPSLGFSSYMENLGQVKNTGLEFTLRGVVLKKEDMNLVVSANGARNRNKLTRISNALATWNDDVDKVTLKGDVKPKVRFMEGQSMNTIWVVRSLGIDPANGHEMFLDKEGKLTYIWNPGDQVAYATSDPDLTGSLSVNFFWKGFSLSVYASYSLGRYQYNKTLVSRVENADLRYNCDARVFTDRWHQPGDRTFFKGLTGESTLPTSRFVQKENFLKMTSIDLSWQAPQKVLAKLRYFKMLKLGFNTNDLFYWSTIKMERGLEYPFARTFNFSLQTSF